MSGLYENELTKTLLETMDDFEHTGLLSRFLTQAKIKHTKVQLKDYKHSNFSKFKASDTDKRTLREVDGIIETEKMLIFIEAKRGANKHEPQQLIGEYQIGVQHAKKVKKDFYLIAIDENITEPDEIKTVRKSSYAGIKKSEVCWISWHEITRLMRDIYDSHEFEGEISKSIFYKRLQKYNSQGFKAFDSFQRDYVNQLARVDEYINALRNYNSEILNFIKGVESELHHQDIIRLYRTSLRKASRKGRRKVEHKVKRLIFDQTSIGISMHKNSIAKAYTFPYADAAWSYDLSKQDLDHYLYLKFSFLSKKLEIGYKIQKNKIIKPLIKADFLKYLNKYKSVNRKSLLIDVTDKHSNRTLKASEVNTEVIKGLQSATALQLFFEYDVLDSDLLEKTKKTLDHLRKFVNEYEFLPQIIDPSKVHQLSTDEIEEEEVSDDDTFET